MITITASWYNLWLIKLFPNQLESEKGQQAATKQALDPWHASLLGSVFSPMPVWSELPRVPPTCDQIQQGLLSICGLRSSQCLFRLWGVILKEQHILRVKSSDLVFKGLI